MARQSSTRSGSRKKTNEATKAAETPSAADTTESVEPGEMGGDTVLVGDGSLGEDAVAPEPQVGDRVTIEPGDTTAMESDADDPEPTEIVEGDAAPAAETPMGEPAATPVAAAAVERVVERRGPGAGMLLIGGVVAAAIGYGAAYLGVLPGNDGSSLDGALADAQATIAAQGSTITELQAQVAELAAVEAPVIPEVDLSGIEDAIAAQASDIAALSADSTAQAGEIATLSGAVEGLLPRIAALEERPIFSGEIAADSAAMAEALDALETRLGEERSAAAAAQAEAQAAAAEAQAAAQTAQEAAAAEVQAAAAAAQAAIAEAQASAQETAAATRTQAAMARLRIAMASGDPFAEALAALDVEVPEALSAVADTGVPTLDALQAAFPAAARAALPIALQETAGDTTGDRIGAFLLGQLGGRSVEPREGDSPDAVLSRAEAAASAGDLQTALAEIEALPQGARAMMDDWVTSAESRAAADAAMADLAASLDN